MDRSLHGWLPFLLLIPHPGCAVRAVDDLSLFNVKDYGAKGDGVTDDTSSVQTAIEAAANATVVFSLPGEHDAFFSSSTVVFPSGHYVLSRTLNFDQTHPPNMLGYGQWNTPLTLCMCHALVVLPYDAHAPESAG